jgi:hypothetical protein
MLIHAILKDALESEHLLPTLDSRAPGTPLSDHVDNDLMDAPPEEMLMEHSLGILSTNICRT